MLLDGGHIYTAATREVVYNVVEHSTSWPNTRTWSIARSGNSLHSGGCCQTSVFGVVHIRLTSLSPTSGKLKDVELVVNGLPGLEFTTKNPGTTGDNRDGLRRALETSRRRQASPFGRNGRHIVLRYSVPGAWFWCGLPDVNNHTCTERMRLDSGIKLGMKYSITWDTILLFIRILLIQA